MISEVSVVTATLLAPDRIGFLEHLYESIRSSDADWEWVVVVDGPCDRTALPESLSADRRVKLIQLAKNVGQACAINIGVEHAASPYVVTPDDDDVLTSGSLEKRLAALREGDLPSRWVASSLEYLMPDGSGGWARGDVWDGAAPKGRCEPGDVWRSWTTPSSTLPLAHTTLMVETDLFRRVGGLQGIAQGEGLGFVMAVTSVAPGVILNEPLYQYRQHPGQVTAGTDFHLMEAMVRQVAWTRGRVLTAEPLAA